jgi:hypothetical protein
MTARATNAFVNNGLGHYGQRQIMAAAAPFGKYRTLILLTEQCRQKSPHLT